MAVSTYGFLGDNKHTDIDLDSAAETIPTDTKLCALEVDNSQNTVDVYVKIYNASPTVGTTAPYFVFKVDAGDYGLFGFTGDVAGHTMTAIFIACVTTAGTAGTTSPTNDVKATLLTET